MTDEKREKLVKNCINGLESLNMVLDTLLQDDDLLQNEKLKNTKNEVEEELDKLNGFINNSGSMKR